MNIRIITWNIKNKFIINDEIGLLNDRNSLDKKIYFKFLNEKVEINFFERNKLDRINIKNKESKIIILVEELDIDKLNYINEVFKNNSFIIMVGKDNLSNEDKDRVIYFPQLLNKNDEINICSLLYMITNEKIFFSSLRKSYIILGEYGENDRNEQIPLFILKRFSKFTKLKRFYLNLYLKEELDLKEISYIEDGLIDYISLGGKIKINQFPINNSNNIYFYLIAN